MEGFRVATWDELEALRMSLESKDRVQAESASRPDHVALSLDRVAEAINRLADAYLYVNQQEDEPSFDGQSLSDREHL
jgi:hypothetical protein